jgi:RNA polymerase sigma factor (sigma-70 family)
VTPSGQQRLIAWLKEPQTVDTIARMVRALSPGTPADKQRELAQQAVLVALRRAGSLRGETYGEIAAWFHQLLRRVWIDEWRKTKPEVSLDVLALVGDEGVPPSTAPHELSRALAQLSERENLVVRLLYVAGFLTSEVARMLGVSMASIHETHVRALRKLRATLS